MTPAPAAAGKNIKSAAGDNMKKYSIASICLGIYLILLGLFWLVHVSSPKNGEEEAARKYAVGKEFLKHSIETKEDFTFEDKAHEDEFTVRYNAFRDHIERVKKNARRVPLINWVISGLVLSTSVAYVFSGILLLRRFRRFKFYFTVGSYLLVVNYFLMILTFLHEMIPISFMMNDLTSIFYPGEPECFSWKIKVPIIAFGVLLFGICYGMYVILPKVIIRHSKAIREIIST